MGDGLQIGVIICKLPHGGCALCTEVTSSIISKPPCSCIDSVSLFLPSFIPCIVLFLVPISLFSFP
jgi:hypothetical protein